MESPLVVSVATAVMRVLARGDLGKPVRVAAARPEVIEDPSRPCGQPSGPCTRSILRTIR
jgi:hypothetical protein